MYFQKRKKKKKERERERERKWSQIEAPEVQEIISEKYGMHVNLGKIIS